MILGASFQYQSSNVQNYEVNPGGRKGALEEDEDDVLTHSGIYFQDRISLTNNLSITGGVRYSFFLFKLNDAFLTDGDQSEEVDFENFTPQIGANWTPFKNISLFANYSEAFQTPTLSEITSGTSPGFLSLKPEQVKSYEVGSRGNIFLAGFPVAYELAYFRMEFTDKILQRRVGFNTVSENSGDTVHQGVELGLNMDLTSNLSSRVSYTYFDFEFTKGDFDGKEVPGQTPHQVFGSLAYKFHLPKKATLTAGAEYRYSASYFVDDNNTIENDNWATFGLKMGYERGRFSANLVVDNLTDEVYSDAVTINSSSDEYFNPADGRTVTGSMSWRF